MGKRGHPGDKRTPQHQKLTRVETCKRRGFRKGKKLEKKELALGDRCIEKPLSYILGLMNLIKNTGI